MPSRYDFRYVEKSPYAHMVGLLQEHAVRGGVVLDLGCGVGAAAEPLSDLGFTYVGCDIDAAALDPLRERGFETHRLDLADLDSLAERIVKLVDGRPVSAILMLDSLEHLADTEAFLGRLRTCSIELGRPLLGLSIPNVGHFDVGAKLVTGRWDVTSTGLLDQTHLQFFTERRLREVMQHLGWFELARRDLEMHHSDQHFPPDHPALADGAPLRELLWRLRRRIGPDLAINQFVRLFTLASVEVDAAPDEELPTPFITVLVRTQAIRMANLLEALTCLAAQTDDDLEVEVLVHAIRPAAVADVRNLVNEFAPEFSRRVNVRVVADGGRARPLNLGIEVARGRYLAFLDDDDLVTANWAESFRAASERAPGRIIRSVTADRAVKRARDGALAPYEPLGRLQMSHTDKFDLLEHFWQNRTPICSFAVPMDAVRALGVRFDEEAAVLEDWNFLLELASLCGVHDTGLVTSVYHRWEGVDSSLSYVHADVWETTRQRILQRFDEGPLLLPRGSASRLARLWQQYLLASRETHGDAQKMLDREVEFEAKAVALRDESAQLRAQIADLHHHLDEARQHVIDSELNEPPPLGTSFRQAGRSWLAGRFGGQSIWLLRGVRRVLRRVLPG